MRYYVEAFYGDGRIVLGNGSGQAALGEVKRPERTAAWRRVLAFKAPEPWKGARRWHLVRADGSILAVHCV